MLTSRAQTSITFSPLQSKLIVPEVDCVRSLQKVVWRMSSASVVIKEACHLQIYFPTGFFNVLVACQVEKNHFHLFSAAVSFSANEKMVPG
jgi:hypothetical protein